jgi:hypothetical protein
MAIPMSRAQVFPNSGPYHSHPKMKLATTAAAIAAKLIVIAGT